MVDVQQINLEDVYVGKDYNKTFQLLDDGTAVDITSYTNLLFTCRKRGTSSNVLDDITMNKVAPYTDGKFSLNLSSSNTSSLTAGYTYDFQIVMTDANAETEVYVTGSFVPRGVF
jgi:hypothetical protein